MVLISYSGREINAKIVYYGPGLSGKTTNLEYIYGAVPQTHRGKMVSMKTKTERTLFFDFLPIDLGELAGFKTRFLLYTVPGQVYYNATRKLVLKGVDAVVFVADSKRGKMDENIESLENLRTNLKEHGLTVEAIPLVIQYNKRDLPDVYSIEELESALNPGKAPSFEAVATNGGGVFETFKMVSRLLLAHLSTEIGVKVVGQPAATEAPPAASIRDHAAIEPVADVTTPQALECPSRSMPVEREAVETEPAPVQLGAAGLSIESHGLESVQQPGSTAFDETFADDESAPPAGMGIRLRRWFGAQSNQGDTGPVVEPGRPVEIEIDADESSEYEIEPANEPRVEPQDQPPPLMVLDPPGESIAHAGEEPRWREIPILVDLRPEDLETGVVLRLRIAVRSRCEGTGEPPQIRSRAA